MTRPAGRDARDPAVVRALAIDRASPPRERTIDITTTGRRSGEQRRIEIWFYRIEGKVHLSSPPATRGWYANLVAHPAFTVHLKHGVRADLAATAVPVTEEGERRRLLAEVVAVLDQDRMRALYGPPAPLEAFVAGSPLVEVRFS
ncbi:MAG: hypothetical protein AVDCRST_MAG35-2277 [uncultured Quadrisphaera sp.]|uniref:DUF385 domain-containing protein n=1 Tax=uncultured Quadrisphaera sp. TaxID=904978 RepID=A0A6J4PVM0_9ACTN|nr:MAG: hypothetical protein AVDCRST_MAG35-2277 [uncultured Quadrisphaera sp.]